MLRAEAVEQAQAGDKCDFTVTLIVVPDVAQINMPGSRAETRGRSKQGVGEFPRPFFATGLSIFQLFFIVLKIQTRRKD